MSRRLPLLTLCAMVLLLPGCMSDLDAKWHAVNDEFRAGNRAFAAVASAYASAADQMAEKKHELQALHLQRDWADFLKIHTNKAGRLVSVDATGAEVPLAAQDLEAAVAARETKQAAIASSRASWSAIHAPFGEAVGQFKAMTESTGKTEDDIIAAKKSAQQFVDSTLAAIGGVAAGALGTALLVP